MTKLRESIKNRKIYGNFSVYSPDGILMFRSNLKKINWYLERDLAEKIDDISIKLKFNPNGLGCHGLDYGLNQMENICVVCGIDGFLTKHHVVPKCYRIHFPENLKSHKFHDVLTVCLDCHYKYEEIAFSYKKQIAENYNAPINGSTISDVKNIKIKGLFSCLLDRSIPNFRIQEIKNEIKKELGIKKITKKVIEKWMNSEFQRVSCIETHGEMVVRKISDINQFIIEWRSHFVNNSNPKFLPKNWSINHES